MSSKYGENTIQTIIKVISTIKIHANVKYMYYQPIFIKSLMAIRSL